MNCSAVPIPANPEAVARAIDQRIIRADDAARFFVTAKSPDLVNCAERFFHALDQAMALVEKGVITPEDLARALGAKLPGGIASDEDLARALGIRTQEEIVAELERFVELS